MKKILIPLDRVVQEDCGILVFLFTFECAQGVDR